MSKLTFVTSLSKLSLSNERQCRCFVTIVTSSTLGLCKFYARPSVRATPHYLYKEHSSAFLPPPYCTFASQKSMLRTHHSPSCGRACRCMCTIPESTGERNVLDGVKSIECSGDDIVTQVEKYFTLKDNFVSQEEQKVLIKETDKHFKGLRYEFDHWDDAIHGYRETEKSRWGPETGAIFQRVREVAFQPGAAQLPLVHVLDLAENGYIKPHVDSIKFCGRTIAGISLISPSVMKLVNENNHCQWVKVLLRPGSLYIMRDKLRFEYTHEILKDDESFINGEKIKRGRRISIMFRDQPIKSKH